MNETRGSRAPNISLKAMQEHQRGIHAVQPMVDYLGGTKQIMHRIPVHVVVRKGCCFGDKAKFISLFQKVQNTQAP